MRKVHVSSNRRRGRQQSAPLVFSPQGIFLRRRAFLPVPVRCACIGQRRAGLLLAALMLFPGLPVEASGHSAPVQQCTGLEDEAQRLQCYDRLFRPAAAGADRQQENEQATGESREAPAVGDMQLPQAGKLQAAVSDNLQDNVAGPEDLTQFGLKAIPVDGPDQVRLVVRRWEQDGHGKGVIWTTTGQVWKQNGPGRLELEQGVEVIVRKGALGSFLLSLPGKSRQYRVKRLR